MEQRIEDAESKREEARRKEEAEQARLARLARKTLSAGDGDDEGGLGGGAPMMSEAELRDHLYKQNHAKAEKAHHAILARSGLPPPPLAGSSGDGLGEVPPEGVVRSTSQPVYARNLAAGKRLSALLPLVAERVRAAEPARRDPRGTPETRDRVERLAAARGRARQPAGAGQEARGGARA